MEVAKEGLQLGGGERVVYVDDEPGLRTPGKRRLEQLGYDPVVAADRDDLPEPEIRAIGLIEILRKPVMGMELATALHKVLRRGARP